MGIIAFLLVGLIAGFVARALVPGPDPMGWLGTMFLGVVGSFVGGTLAALVFGGTLDLSASGLVGSILVRIQYYMLDAATQKVFSDAVMLTETYVTPVLERKGFGIKGAGPQS